MDTWPYPLLANKEYKLRFFSVTELSTAASLRENIVFIGSSELLSAEPIQVKFASYGPVQPAKICMKIILTTANYTTSELKLEFFLATKET